MQKIIDFFKKIYGAASGFAGYVLSLFPGTADFLRRHWLVATILCGIVAVFLIDAMIVSTRFMFHYMTGIKAAPTVLSEADEKALAIRLEADARAYANQVLAKSLADACGIIRPEVKQEQKRK